MEFKEKLQYLRTQMKISQEELANQLNISRQSVTKWENGQSFPDIQNLILISEIFKVSIDRLVKDMDCSSTKPYCGCKHPQENIRLFLVKAKNKTYAADENAAVSSRPLSHDYLYSENDLLYLDTYLEGQEFIGEEGIWVKKNAVWGMNYYGNILEDTFAIHFLKEALSFAAIEYPFRGPEFYHRGDYTYICKVGGDFDFFQGEETIFCRQDKVYSCMFHGGSLS